MDLDPEERVEINRQMRRYFLALDEGDWASLGDIFTHDAVMEYLDKSQTVGGGASPVTGLSDILASHAGIFAHVSQTVRACSVEVTANDDVVVYSTTSLFGRGNVGLQVEHTDYLRRTPIGWRIHRKSLSAFVLPPGL